jgi:DNA-binding NarL/FixJ family response regulator
MQRPEFVLDPQEVELLRLLADGLVLEAVARRMSLSERTVRRRLRALCDRFGVDAPVQVVVIAARHGIL